MNKDRYVVISVNDAKACLSRQHLHQLQKFLKKITTYRHRHQKPPISGIFIDQADPLFQKVLPMLQKKDENKLAGLLSVEQALQLKQKLLQADSEESPLPNHIRALAEAETKASFNETHLNGDDTDQLLEAHSVIFGEGYPMDEPDEEEAEEPS